MAILPFEGDWRQSEDHWKLLSWLNKPSDIEKIVKYQKSFPRLGEWITTAINRFLDEGVLVECSLAEKVAFLNNLADLQGRLKRNGILMTGSKGKLVQCLIDIDSSNLETEYGSRKIVKCSPKGFSFLDSHQGKEETHLLELQQNVFTHLVNMDIVSAKRLYYNFCKKLNDKITKINDGDFQFHRLRSTLEKSPITIIEKHDESTRRKLHAAAAMGLFWSRVNPQWLSENVGLEVSKIEIAVQLINRYQEYLDVIRDYAYEHQGLYFGEDNPDICENCRGFEGTVVEVDRSEEWPFDGCTNPIGCLPLRHPYDDSDEDIDGIEFSIDENDDGITITTTFTLNPLIFMRANKKKFEDGRITEAEYHTVRREILDCM